MAKHTWLAWWKKMEFRLNVNSVGRIATILLLGIMSSNCSSRGAHSYVSAEVTQWIKDPSGIRTTRKMHITDAETIKALAEFFPGMGEGKTAWKAGAWVSYAQIRFARSDGGEIIVDTNYEEWGEEGGKGSFAIKPGFEAFGNKLFSEH